MYWMIEWRTEVLVHVGCFSRFIAKRRVAEFELYFIFYLWATIIESGISCQVSVIFKMSGVIQFTDKRDSSILGILFEVSTDTVVVHVAEKLTLNDPSLWRIWFWFHGLPNVYQRRRSNLETALCDLSL